MASERTFIVHCHSTTALSNLNRQRKEGYFCDVILQVERRKFYAHRSLLSASSEYFYKMFTVDMKEKYDKTVTFKDITTDAMEALLEFIYTEKIVLNEENVSDILHAASIMQIQDALDVIISYLSEVLDAGNCLYFRKLGHFHSLPKLVAETDLFILDHFEAIAEQEAFLDLDSNELDVLFASDKLRVTEEKLVFETIEKWVNKDLEEKKTQFPKLFKNLRLQFVPVKYVAARVRKNKLVREFPDCRDLVEDAFFFHISPEMVVPEEPRDSYKPEPDAVMCVNANIAKPSIYDVTKKTWSAGDFEGWTQNLVKANCAVGINCPKAIFCGGLQDNTVSNEVVQFDGTRWITLPAMKVARCGAAAVYCRNKIFVFGGETVVVPLGMYYNYQENPQARTNFAEDFESFSLDKWKIEGTLPTRRSYAVAELLEDKIYFISGYTYNETSGVPNYDPMYGTQIRYKEASKTTDIYNLKTQKWNEGPSLKVARACCGSAVINKTIYVLGGWSSNQGYVNGAEYLDVNNGVWIAVATKSAFNLNLTPACRANDQIYICSNDYNYLIRFDPTQQQCWYAEQGNRPAGSVIIPYVLPEKK